MGCLPVSGPHIGLVLQSKVWKDIWSYVRHSLCNATVLSHIARRAFDIISRICCKRRKKRKEEEEEADEEVVVVVEEKVEEYED